MQVIARPASWLARWSCWFATEGILRRSLKNEYSSSLCGVTPFICYGTEICSVCPPDKKIVLKKQTADIN